MSGVCDPVTVMELKPLPALIPARASSPPSHSIHQYYHQ